MSALNTVLYYVLVFLALYCGFIALLIALARVIPVCGFYGRVMLAWSSLCACGAYGVFTSPALKLVGYGGLSQWLVARGFKWIMLKVTNTGFIIEGEEHLKLRPCVFVMNHQSELDILALGWVQPQYSSVAAKASLKYVPFLGQFLALSNTIFIERGNRTRALAAFNKAAQQMRRQQQSVIIFAEGTRSHSLGPELLPFKKGAFHLATQGQVPIVPIVVANYSNVLSLKRRVFNPNHVPVKVLPPIETTGLTADDVDDLMTKTRDLMLKELETLSEKARATGVSIPIEEAQRLEEKIKQKKAAKAAAKRG